MKILSKREDGFHNIETIFHRINLFDEIEIIETDKNIEVEIISGNLINDKNNLCFKAAEYLNNFCGTQKGVLIKLKKNIPIGAGLGGGSSDAATVLLALNNLWNLNLSIDELNKIAIKIGSDVPYFLNYNSAFATGRGEVLNYFKIDLPFWILLVNPGINISTAEAYQSLSNLKNRKIKSLPKFSIDNLNEILSNDFEDVILNNFSEINKIKSDLINFGAKFALMSGSGSSVFGLFENENQVQNAKIILIVLHL